jgi:uncharacterized protein YjbJ (UPF0337 family)
VVFSPQESSAKLANEEDFIAESGSQEGVRGVVEGVKGKAKEAIGNVTGQDELAREGEAQQDKAEAQRDAAKKEADAESARGSAAASEKREQAHQR